jgi:hypothetical protein
MVQMRTSGLGTAIPLVTMAYLLRAGFLRIRQKVSARIGVFKKTFSVIIGVADRAIVMGWDKLLEALITNVLPDRRINLTILV